jgi:hypothetical protein
MLTLNRFWSARVNLATLKLTHHQRSLLNGLISIYENNTNKYASALISSLEPTISHDLAPDCIPIEQRLVDFLDGPARVLLLSSPQGAGKSHLCKYLAAIAWKQKSRIPIFVTLDPTKPSPLHEHLVEEALASHGLDADTIQHARAMHQFLLIVEGFDLCKVQTNAYVRYKLQGWPGKAVFTTRSEYVANAPYLAYYFMPATGVNHRADPSGFLHISFTSQFASSNTVETDSLVPAQPSMHFPCLSYHNFHNLFFLSIVQLCSHYANQQCQLNPS